MGRESRMMFGRTADDRSAVDQRIGAHCAATAASIVVILAAIAVIALL
ncbi:hypothetical protein [Gordonia hydrophobica]|uniref:Uncharacterized protein n=1 Tax=Gordonia hydrophobica TaxID=40516 RepID=A0ABZ2U4Q6_9ACTN|nr:hypothetical protein [Gordonia hydrophobica]MBM7368167.1 hypothetical protein [Gordonia hydrophobica]